MENIKKLADKIPDTDIDWMVKDLQFVERRLQCVLIPYLSVRTVQNILNKRAGHDGWQFQLATISLGGTFVGFKAGIGIRAGLGTEWLWRAGVATLDLTKGDPEDYDPLKKCESGALKRAAQKWGIGARLTGVSIFITQDQIHSTKDKKAPKGKKIIRLIDKELKPVPVDSWCLAPLQKDWPKGA